MTKKLTVPLAWMIIVAFIAATTAFAAEQPLLGKSTRVFSLEQGSVRGGVDQPWLSSSELLHFKANGQLYRYDITSKADTTLPALTRQVISSNAYLDFIDASPDGQWILWGMSSSNPIYVADIDGKQRYSLPSNGMASQPLWSADGNHIVQLLFGIDTSTSQFLHATDPSKDMVWTEEHVADVTAPQNARTIKPLPKAMNGLEVLGALSPDELVARAPDPEHMIPSKATEGPKKYSGNSFTVTEDFVIDNQATLRKLQHISIWNPAASRPLHVYSITCPGPVQSVSLSPKGDRLAWSIMPSATPTASSDQLGKGGRMSLWTSALDGSGMREIGYMDIAPDKILVDKKPSLSDLESEADPIPMEVRWSPDESRLSFDCNGYLWIVPAE